VGIVKSVVFFHGLMGTTDADPFVTALAERFDVEAPLLPGFNDLAELDDLRDVHDLALWADDLLEARGLDGVTVIGHSFGGMVAAELAAHVPKRVGRLVLIDALGLWDDGDPVTDVFRVFPLGLPDVLWTDPVSVEAQATVAALATAEPGVDDAALAVMLNMVKGMTTVGKYLWPLPDKGLARRLRRISAPTLVLWGAKDKVASSAYADRFVAGIPNATARIVDDAGHMLPYERTSEIVERIATFLE
jgi:pimeloyl-ACP methyl ester carboxylesterase